jgi:hypothetical protein
MRELAWMGLGPRVEEWFLGGATIALAESIVSGGNQCGEARGIPVWPVSIPSMHVGGVPILSPAWLEQCHVGSEPDLRTASRK